MRYSPLMIADQDRADQFRLIGSIRNPFRNSIDVMDANGVAWRRVRVGDHWFGVTWLGPAWVFDPTGQKRRQDDLVRMRQEMAAADNERHKQELRAAVDHVRWGEHAERLLWGIHATVLQTGEAINRIPDTLLAALVWGPSSDSRPRHWRSDLLELMTGFTWLHVAKAGSNDGDPPVFDANTALVTHVADLRGDAALDVCDERCPLMGTSDHHHFLVNIGRGYLGCLERLVRSENDGVRQYHFRQEKVKKGSPSLRSLGRSGSLASIYLPARIGDPARCQRLTPKQHQILQVLVRETTRRAKKTKDEPTQPEIVANGLVPAFARRTELCCPLLDAGSSYVAFNGNKRRKGQGHRILTWAIRCGYRAENLLDFLKDLACMAAVLSLTVVGIARGNEWFSLDQLIAAADGGTIPGLAERVHLRMYVPVDYLDRWNTYFGWSLHDEPCVKATQRDVYAVRLAMRQRGMSQRQFAGELDIAPSFLSRVLRGLKPVPEALRRRAEELVQAGSVSPVVGDDGPIRRIEKNGAMSDIAIAYRHDFAWSVVPQVRGMKKPPIRWKPYQDEPATEQEMKLWWRNWPDAGIALITGSLSGVFVIDVDGPEAHSVLLHRLGAEPDVPKVRSGSGSPYRYHLYFRHPQILTTAKATPWHPKLEFRGESSLVILPPSIHKSGNPYVWERPVTERVLPDLPSLIVETLAVKPVIVSTTSASCASDLALEVSPSTAAFLSGKHANGPNWNERLFRAACDLHGRGVPLDRAEPALLTGAGPWNAAEADAARRTIRSAYSAERSPAVC